MLMLTGRFAINPQARGAFMVFAKGMVQRQRAQPGCLSFGLYEDVTQPNTFLMVEQWESYEAFNRFGMTAAFEHDEDTLNGFMVGEPSYDEYEFSVPPGVN
jgi:quinol monooxygenase YgiN